MDNIDARVGHFVKDLLDNPIVLPKHLDGDYDFRNGYRHAPRDRSRFKPGPVRTSIADRSTLVTDVDQDFLYQSAASAGKRPLEEESSYF
jgi:hypothetical protein